MKHSSLVCRILTFGVLAVATACGSNSTGQPSGAYTVGGTVTGLATGKSVVLQINGGNSLTVSTNASFTFSTGFNSGAAYAVTVQTQPTGSNCVVTSGTGTVGTANVTNVGVNCGTAMASAWAGTATSVTGVINSTAVVTWTFLSVADNIAYYGPTGTVSATVPACTLSPSSGTLDVTHDGLLAVDYSVTPATYHGTGTTVWQSTWTCPPTAPFVAGVAAGYFGGSHGLLNVEAQGLVSGDGTLIQGTDTNTSGSSPVTFSWTFARAGVR